VRARMEGGAKMIFGSRAGFPAVAPVAMRETSILLKPRLIGTFFFNSFVLFYLVSFISI
jgi:hypothetical protein